MNAAVIYAAKSSPDEKESVASQVEHIVAHLEREGGRAVLGTFTEQNVSGYRRSRGPELEAAMGAAIEAAQEHGAAELWVFHSTRLARGSGKLNEARALGEVFYELRRHGVTLRSVSDDPYVTDEAFVGMASKMAHKFSEDLSAHTSRGKRRRAQRGRPNGRVPYGYRVEGKGEDSRLVPDPAQAVIVRRIFESFAAGQSQMAIAKGLNGEHTPTQRNGRWAQGTVRGILANSVYLGKVTHHGETFDGEHEPLVDLALWQRAQRLLTSGTRGRGSAGAHLFRGGMLRCGTCGSSMAPRTKRRKDGSVYETYTCMGRRDRGRGYCPASDVRRAVVDVAALRYFEQVGLDVDATRVQFERAFGARLAEIEALRDEATREAMRKRAAAHRIESDYMDGIITGEAYERLSGRLDAELTALEAQVDHLAAREREVKDAAALGDAESAMLTYLTQIRRAITSDVRDADGIQSVRSALAVLFESFTLYPRSTPVATMLGCTTDAELDAALAAYKGAPLDAVDELAEVRRTNPIDTDASYMLVPHVRRDALEGLAEGFTPIMRKIPLGKRADNYLMNSISLYLSSPIPVGAGRA